MRLPPTGPGRAVTPRARPDGRPRLRGWIHAAAAPVVLAAGIVLTWRAPTAPAAAAVGVFAAASAWLFTVSALYHLGRWPPRVRVILRRIDHADILFLIAGTYTPVAVLALHDGTRVAILAVVWAGAALSAVFSVAWTDAPRWVHRRTRTAPRPARTRARPPRARPMSGPGLKPASSLPLPCRHFRSDIPTLAPPSGRAVPAPGQPSGPAVRASRPGQPVPGVSPAR
jgi:hypothetical protein